MCFWVTRVIIFGPYHHQSRGESGQCQNCFHACLATTHHHFRITWFFRLDKLLLQVCPELWDCRSAPHQFLKKGQLGWHQEVEDAFLSLKRVMTITPTLAMLNFNDPFSIEVDASRASIGVVLKWQTSSLHELCAWNCKTILVHLC